ncbi:MAG: hypothetical protein EP319_14105 [Deltaproteobacteria bacterium]|nr:MAG: hypothetical protein EP319_14105 [Deltaproteobacteria bacterium]
MKTFLIFLSLSLSLSVLGQEQKKKNLAQVLKENNISKTDLKNELIGIINPSQANREGKRVSILIGTGNRHDMMTRSITVEQYYDSNKAFGVSFSKGKDRYASFEDLSLRDMEADILEAHTKLFLGNSFYTRTSLGVRLMKGKARDQYDSNTYSYIEGETVNRKDGTLTVDLGNQWQWENFTLAMNWIGLNYQVLGESKFSNDNRTTANLLNFNIGLSF